MTTMDISRYRHLLKTIRIPHPSYAAALRELNLAYAGVGATDFPVCCQLLGPSRGGKTQVIRDLMEALPPVHTPEGTHHPIVYAEIPPKGTTMGLIENLLRALGDPYWARGTESNKLSRLIMLLQSCACRMIVLDEFQHLIDKGQNMKLKLTIDFIKALVEPNQWALVASGLPQASAVIDRDPQLRGRFDVPLVLPRFDWLNDSSHDEFRGVLVAFQDSLDPFELPSLAGEEMALRMYLATGGLIGLVVKLLQRAVNDAIEENRLAIGLSQLNSAFRRAIRFSKDLPAGEGPFEAKLFGVPHGKMLARAVNLATDIIEVEDGSSAGPTPKRSKRQTIAEHKRELAEAL